MEKKTMNDELLLSATMGMICTRLKPEEQQVVLGLAELLQPTICRNIELLTKKRTAIARQLFPTQGDDVLMDLPLRLIKNTGRHYERTLQVLRQLDGRPVHMLFCRGKSERETEQPLLRVAEWTLPQYERTVRVALSKELVLRMVDMRDGYMRASRDTLAHLRAPHTRQMYFLLKKWAGNGGLEVSYRKIRRMLGLPPDTATGWRLFKRAYLKKPQDNLREKMQRQQSEMAFTFAVRPADNGDRIIAFFVDCPRADAQAREDTATQSCIGLCGHLLRQMKFDDDEVSRLLAPLNRNNARRAADMLCDVLTRVEKHQVDHVKMYVAACMAKIAHPVRSEKQNPTRHLPRTGMAQITKP